MVSFIVAWVLKGGYDHKTSPDGMECDPAFRAFLFVPATRSIGSWVAGGHLIFLHLLQNKYPIIAVAIVFANSNAPANRVESISHKASNIENITIIPKQTAINIPTNDILIIFNLMLMLLFLSFQSFYRGRISMMAATTDIRFVIKGRSTSSVISGRSRRDVGVP